MKRLRKIIPKFVAGLTIKSKKKELGADKLTHGYMRHIALGGSPMATFPGTKWNKTKKKRQLNTDMTEGKLVDRVKKVLASRKKPSSGPGPNPLIKDRGCKPPKVIKRTA